MNVDRVVREDFFDDHQWEAGQWVIAFGQKHPDLYQAIVKGCAGDIFYPYRDGGLATMFVIACEVIRAWVFRGERYQVDRWIDELVIECRGLAARSEESAYTLFSEVLCQPGLELWEERGWTTEEYLEHVEPTCQELVLRWTGL